MVVVKDGLEGTVFGLVVRVTKVVFTLTELEIEVARPFPDALRRLAANTAKNTVTKAVFASMPGPRDL